jgi:hypothetical protein
VSHEHYSRAVVDTALGLLGLVLFIVAVIAFAAGVTFLVIKLTALRNGKQAEKA